MHNVQTNDHLFYFLPHAGLLCTSRFFYHDIMDCFDHKGMPCMKFGDCWYGSWCSQRKLSCILPELRYLLMWGAAKIHRHDLA